MTMKIRKHFIFAAMLLGLSLSACNQSNPKITGYSVDENNNVIVIYDNGSQENVGNLTDEDIVNHVTSVIISQDGYYVINGIKTSIKVQFDSVEISDDGYYVVNGIKTDIKATEVYTVKFTTGYSSTVPEQKVFEGHKVERPQLNRDGYDLDGWFYNDEEWRFNSDVVLNDMTLLAKWTAKQYTISFINEKGTNPSDMVVTYDSQVTLPNVDSIDGYTFSGWHNGNSKVNSGVWTIADDVTLTAKWTANTYTVTLDANGGSVYPATKQVTYGQNYSLPVPTNTFGAFKGWYYDDVKLTDENGSSVAPWSYTENITVTTSWIEEISSLSQLKAIASGLNGHYKLVSNIDLTDAEWMPIGSTASPFTGVFDGNGYKLVNLSIAETNGSEIGLFGCSTGTIKNVTLEDVNVDLGTISSNSYVAALVANNKGILDNITSSGEIKIANHSATLTSYVAGITARNTGTLKDIVNSIDVSGGTYTGGVCAYDETTDANIAGLRLVNNGTVLGLQVAGGVYAYSKQKTYSYMKNSGNVTAVNNVGGIVGVNTAAVNRPVTFKYCVNNGAITSTDNSHGTSYAGGLSSEAYEVSISDSYNTGLITGYNKGGLLGYNIGTGSYTRCLNTASCTYGFSDYMGNGSTIYDSMDYGTSTFARGYATVTNSYHEKPSDFAFYKEILFWSESVWNFEGITHPTLVWEN